MASYENGDKVKITLQTPTNGAEIYYTVDNSNTLTGKTVSDPTKTGQIYKGEFEVNIENIAGGKLYIVAAAKKDGKWSSTSRKDLTFLKGVKENAFVVNGTGYSSWNDAVSAINSLENGGTIVLNDDVELSNESVMPTKPCTIKSADGNAYKVTANILNAQSDVVFDGITYDISRAYANGHSVTVKDTITYKKSWLGRKIYAGGTEDARIIPRISSSFIQNILKKQIKAQADSQYQEPISATIYKTSGVVTAMTDPDYSVGNQPVYGNCRVHVTFQIKDQTTRRVEGLVMFFFTLIYLGIAGAIYVYKRKGLLPGLVDFSADYAWVQKKLLMDLDIPYAMTDETGHILWMNQCFSELVQGEKSKIRSISVLFPEITKEVLEKLKEKCSIHTSLGDGKYRVDLKPVRIQGIGEAEELFGANKELFHNGFPS